MSKELGTIKLSKTDDGIRIDISGELANCCCCCNCDDDGHEHGNCCTTDEKKTDER
jgi:hypothetical protein